MEWYKNLSFRWKLSLPLLALTGLFILAGIKTIHNTKILGHYSNSIAQIHLQEIQLLIQADRDLYQAQAAQRSLIFHSNNEQAQLLKDVAENAQQAYDRTIKALGLASIPSAQEKNEFIKRYEQWKAISDEITIALASDKTNAEALSYGNYAKAFKELRSYIDDLEESRLKEVEQKTLQVETDVATITTMTLAAVALVVFIAVFTSFQLPRLIVTPLAEITASVRAVADGNGDLTKRLPVSSRDELGRLAENFNGFMEKLQTLVRDNIQYADIVEVEAQELLTQSTNSQRAVERQEVSISMVVTAVNELTKAIAEVALNTTNAAGHTQKVADNTHQVQGRIRHAVGQIKTLTQSISDTTEVMLRLENQAKEVTSVIDVIRGVAEQTNLLALNAAIEAARAGEQGRGFAVVADEVRTLASRTQQSTQDIQNMLQFLQNGVQAAVNAMSASNTITQDAVVAANEAEAALGSVSDGVRSISDMTLQTATAAEEQSLVTNEIDRNLVEIHDLSSGTAKDAKKTYQYSQNLSSSASHMKELLGRFKI
ncbi:MAG: methyl-accepting chemotaxis protein [Marinagarivorans sp.]